LQEFDNSNHEVREGYYDARSDGRALALFILG